MEADLTENWFQGTNQTFTFCIKWHHCIVVTLLARVRTHRRRRMGVRHWLGCRRAGFILLPLPLRPRPLGRSLQLGFFPRSLMEFMNGDDTDLHTVI